MGFSISNIVRIGILFLLLTSCISTEVLNAPEVEQVDTVRMYKPHRPHPPAPPSDTTEVDTTRVPIGFNPSVGDWEEEDIDL